MQPSKVWHFLEMVVVPAAARRMHHEINSFRAVCKVLALVQKLKKRPTRLAAQCSELQHAQEVHLQRFITAYGEGAVIPKHHLYKHIPAQIQRDQMLLDTFVHERKHRCIRRVGESITTRDAWEASVLSRVAQAHLQMLERDGELETACSPMPQLAACLEAESVELVTSMSVANITLHVADVFEAGGHACALKKLARLFL